MRDHKLENNRERGRAGARKTTHRVGHARRRRRNNTIVVVGAGALVLLVIGGILIGRLGAASALDRTAPVVTGSPVAAIEPSASAPVSLEESTVAEPAPVAKPKRKVVTAQRLNIKIGNTGYEPSVVRASADRPITLVVEQGDGCAAGFLMPSLGVDADNSSGQATVKLGTLKPGTYGFTCGMGMVAGELVVR